MLGYYHPINGEPIYNVTLSLSYTKQKNIKNHVASYSEEGLVELFVMFSYEPTRRSQILSTIDVSHKIAMCPVVRKFTPCAYEGYLRYAGFRHHICTSLIYRNLTETALFDRSVNPAARQIGFARGTVNERLETRKVLLDMLLPLIGGTAVSYSTAGSSEFHSFCRKLIELARTHPSLTPKELYPAMSPMFLSYEMHRRADQMIRNALLPLRNSVISIMIDAGTIAHKHTLAVAFCRLSLDAQPQFLQLCHGPASTVEYYSTLMELATELLYKYAIEIGVICTDGLVSQITAVKRLNLRLAEIAASETASFRYILPVHFPCLNHRVNLVTQHYFSDDGITGSIKEKLRLFAVEANKKRLHDIFGKPCPTLLEWRWLSAHFIASFVRLHRMAILEHNILPLDDLISILRCEIVLTPLMELQLFFESAKMKLCFIFPAILRCFHQYGYIICSKHFSNPQSFTIITKIVVKLFNEVISGYIGSLAFLAFILTPIGRLLLQQNRILSAYTLWMPLEAVPTKLFDICSVLCFPIISL